MSANGEGSGGRVRVVSCYAPIRAARREVKDAFFQELDHILASVLSGEKSVLLGDFNACVGSREHVGDKCDAVRGPQGMESPMMQERSCCPFHNYIRQQCVTHYSRRRLSTSGHGQIQRRSNGAA